MEMQTSAVRGHGAIVASRKKRLMKGGNIRAVRQRGTDDAHQGPALRSSYLLRVHATAS
jgi:hypothetical protein